MTPVLCWFTGESTGAHVTCIIAHSAYMLWRVGASCIAHWRVECRAGSPARRPEIMEDNLMSWALAQEKGGNTI